MSTTRTCEAYAPLSIQKCGLPVKGSSRKRFCSRTCQNRAQKERWRGVNRLADIRIRMGEGRRRRLQVIECMKIAVQEETAEFPAKYPQEARWVEEAMQQYGIQVRSAS